MMGIMKLEQVISLFCKEEEEEEEEEEDDEKKCLFSYHL
jgi:hypothetical protein